MAARRAFCSSGQRNAVERQRLEPRRQYRGSVMKQRAPARAAASAASGVWAPA
jgi:hypothetical protein